MNSGRLRLSRRSSEVARLRDLLRSREDRFASDTLVLEGKTLIADAADRGVELLRVYIAAGSTTAFASDLERYAAAGAEIIELGDGAIERIASTRTPQPLLAEVPSPFAITKPIAEEGLIVALDGVSDPGNLGTILRGAEAAGVAGIVHINGCDISASKVIRASAGAVFAMPIVEAPSASRAVLAQGDRRVLGATAREGQSLQEIDWAVATTVVFGSESHGISEPTAALLDGWVHIPMAGAVESLNVAMAVNVLAFHAGITGGTLGTGRTIRYPIGAE